MGTFLLFAVVVVMSHCLLTVVAQGSREHENFTVAIDPGHGGMDAGVKGEGGLAEKDVTMVLARKVASSLSARYRVLLTRTGDYNVDPADRVATANRAGASLYISIHTGGAFSPASEGIVVFYPDDAVAAGAEETVLPAGGSKAERALTWTGVCERHLQSSRRMAMLAEKALDPLVSPGGFAAVRRSPLVPLEGANMPAILIELGSLENPAVASRLEDPGYLSAAATAICAAVNRFFGGR